jgi:hypothetical protein
VDTKQKSNFVLRLQGRWLWDENAIIQNLAEICGDDAVTHYRSEENDDEMGFFDFLGGENDAEAKEEEDDEAEEG